MNEIFRQRNAPRIVGISIFIMFLLMTGAVLLFLQRNGVFNKRNVYFLEANQTQLRGLHKSMDIRILGESVGTVTNMAYVGSSDRVRLTLTLQAPDELGRNAVWENSRIVISRSLGIGSAYLEIERGTDILGAVVSNTTERDVARMRTEGEKSSGVKIEKLIQDSPAQKAALTAGQIVTQFNSSPLNGIRDLYDAMARVSAGDEIELKIFGEREPVRLIAEPVEPNRLDDGGLIFQFQPEFDTVQFVADRMAQVQESISAMEQNVVATLQKTNVEIDSDLKPTIAQYLETGKSIQSTSDTLRMDTLGRFADTLDEVDRSAVAFTNQIESIGKQLTELSENQIVPAVKSFSNASTALGETSVEMKKATAQASKDTSDLIGDMRTTTSNLNKLVEQSAVVVEAVASETRDLPGTVQGVNQAVDKADTLIDGVSNHWLLRRSINKSRELKGQPANISSRGRGLRGAFKRRN